MGEGGVGGVGFGWRLLSLTKIVRLWKKLSHGEKWVYFCDVKANQECFHNRGSTETGGGREVSTLRLDNGLAATV